jgi:hypothetical protein
LFGHQLWSSILAALAVHEGHKLDALDHFTY